MSHNNNASQQLLSHNGFGLNLYEYRGEDLIDKNPVIGSLNQDDRKSIVAIRQVDISSQFPPIPHGNTINQWCKYNL